VGANLCIRQITAKNREDVSKQVRDITAEMGFEDGHSYSGTWASAEPGVTFPTEIIFPTTELAEEWIADNHGKWNNVYAVRATTQGEKTFPLTAGDRKLGERLVAMDKQIAGFPQVCIDIARKRKSKLKACEYCNSKIATRYISTLNCPVCERAFLYTDTDSNRMDAWRDKRTKLQEQIRERRRVIYDEQKGTMSKLNVWIVGGWCSC
jgi:hypothetical protein